MKELDNSVNLPEILRRLDKTPYAFSSTTQLSGGLANLTYQGELIQPLQDGSNKVIIKYGEEKCAAKEFDAKRLDLTLSTSRCVSGVQQSATHDSNNR